MVTPSSVPLLLVKVPVLVNVPLAIVPLSVVAPVRAVVPPPLLIVLAMVLPPAPFSATLCAVMGAPTEIAPADTSDSELVVMLPVVSVPLA